jgi:CDP-6-deoxy-D-xylo-4-hexulose-3-dehydrase
MIKLSTDTNDRDDINALIEWLSQDPIPQLTKGPLTRELESHWADKIGTKYSVFVNSGSSSILLTLAALREIGYLKNDIIVVPSLSWSTDVSSPILLDMEPVLCDCNLHDLSCNLNELENIFKRVNPSAFILVSPLGLVPRMDKIVELCEKYDVILLEDVCESMGSKFNDKYLGSFGKASFFSTYFGHHISTIEGGFINTNDDKLYEALLMMRSHGWTRDLPNQTNGKIEFNKLYKFILPGFNLRSTDLQAFLGIRAIDKLDEFSKKRNENFFYYKTMLKHNLLDIKIHENHFISNFAYPVVIKNRDEVIQRLQENNIEIRPLIAGNMATQPMWAENYFIPSLPNSELIDRYGFYLPNHHGLEKKDIELITNIVNET